MPRDTSDLKPYLRRALDEWHWMPVAVLAMGVLSIGLLIASDRIHDRLVAKDLSLVCAVSALQTQAATAHLWVKEQVSGDLENEPEIWERLDSALQVSDAILFGGTAHGQVVMPIDEQPLRALALDIRRQILKLRDVTEKRQALYAGGADVGIGSSLDMEHDDIFYALTDLNQALEMAIVERVKERQVQAQLLFRTILIAWVVIVATAVTGLWNRERRRRQAETALRESEAQLLQAQKMEAVGRLAGGIAHDINNYLAAINAQCELLRMKAEPGGRVANKMDSVIATTNKASTLIKRLLAFSRRQPVQPEVVNLNRVVEGLGRMMTRLIGEDIRLETSLSQAIWNVRIDPSQLEQIIVNLLVNSREAMPTGGRLRLETGNESLDESFSDNHLAAVDPGDYVVLSVTDTGIGIPSDIQDKIFEPFFTTKEEAGRSGLGLATVYGIVRQNKGTITVDSQVGDGSAFRIYLPRCLAPETRAVTADAEMPARIGGHEKILLVEDNDDLRDSTRGVLEAMGYQVQVAADGEEALRLFDDGGSDLDLLITDVVMPGMSGREVMDRIRERKEDLQVIFISGYTDNVILRHGIRDGEFEFLQKPFSAESLASKIREVLGGRPEPRPATG